MDEILIQAGNKREGIFKDEGSYDIESEIIPFLSTLKGFKFGFNSGLRAEVLFINTKEITVKWGTRQAINIPHPSLPGGMPIRAFGSFNVKISDYMVLIDKIAGIKGQFTVDDVKQRALAVVDQLLMKWIAKEGKDMFNLQANSVEIARGIRTDLDMEMIKIGLTVTTLNIESFSYPESVQNMINKNAAYGIVTEENKSRFFVRHSLFLKGRLRRSKYAISNTVYCSKQKFMPGDLTRGEHGFIIRKKIKQRSAFHVLQH